MRQGTHTEESVLDSVRRKLCEPYAALVGNDDKVWCYQYTVSNMHPYKKHRTKPQFLNHITVLSTTKNEVVMVLLFQTELTSLLQTLGVNSRLKSFRLTAAYWIKWSNASKTSLPRLQHLLRVSDTS